MTKIDSSIIRIYYNSTILKITFAISTYISLKSQELMAGKGGLGSILGENHHNTSSLDERDIITVYGLSRRRDH